MTSLNNFKMAERQVDEPVIPPNLDTMLGNLQVSFLKEQHLPIMLKELRYPFWYCEIPSINYLASSFLKH